ncbi:hypothetical protein KQX54_003608 [Cotesia glomerata]|uniref:Uncharacterized protein n=1 Tax=Cotesia glomerata TaxID=32391 RepID=A0AAV7HXX6_COTGL|nr:hypothetical protein KQX54_003608 [Cotesia glomerata]
MLVIYVPTSILRMDIDGRELSAFSVSEASFALFLCRGIYIEEVKKSHLEADGSDKLSLIWLSRVWSKNWSTRTSLECCSVVSGAREE